MLLFSLSDFFSKDTNKIIGEIFSYIMIVAGTYLVARLKKWIETIKFKGQHNTQFLTEVYEKVVELRKDYNCQRSFIFLRHNGTKLANNKGLDKISMIYESVDSYIKSIRSEQQAVPLHLFNSVFNKIDEEDGCVFTIESLEEGYLKRLMINNGSTMLIVVPFRKTKRSIPEGYIGISYVGNGNNMPDEKGSLLELESLKERASSIGYLLRA